MTTPRSIVEDGIAAAVLAAALEARTDLDASERGLLEVLFFDVLGPVPAGAHCPACDAFATSGPVTHRGDCKGSASVTWAFTGIDPELGRERFSQAVLAWGKDVMPVAMRNNWLSGELRRAELAGTDDAHDRAMQARQDAANRNIIEQVVGR